ncbi:MAG: hypothetical protein NWE98_05755 [Candidatus Bathyarchaeota archaeon]|nr:hypothetical protein [Candidatus Bathyarchaeota archaeon]
MYNELYEAWKREITQTSLGALPSDFYARIAQYIKHIKEENRQDQKSVKISLLEHEAQNVERMLEELLATRYRKIIKMTTKTQKVPVELLTVEETKMTETFAAFTDAYQKFSKSLLQGQSSTTQQPIRVILTQPVKAEAKLDASIPSSPPAPKRLTVRFSKAIPAIMGSDMKSYGPFQAEDVASLPELNAKILVKQGLAVLVEVS